MYGSPVLLYDYGYVDVAYYIKRNGTAIALAKSSRPASPPDPQKKTATTRTATATAAPTRSIGKSSRLATGKPAASLPCIMIAIHRGADSTRIDAVCNC
jgi:hypothetical protein